MRLTLLCLTLLTALAACKKDKKLDVDSYWRCNEAQNLDSTAISAKLIGSWIWNKRACFEAATESANKNIQVTFRADGTFSVNENATSLTQGTWKLEQANHKTWQLNLSSRSDYLYGRILFCDNQVLFNQSYLDGCDNLFNKL